MADSNSDPSAHPFSADEESKAPNSSVKPKIGKSHRNHKETHGKRKDIDENTSIDEVKAPNMFERVKEEIDALVQTIHPKKESQFYEKKDEVVESNAESHGRSNTIDEKTPIDEVKGPNIFDRAKEEIEALVHTIHHKKEPDSPRKEGFGSKIGRCLEKVCSPPKGKNDNSQHLA